MNSIAVRVEHYMQMLPGIDLVPSAAVLGHGLLHSLWLWLVLFRHHHPPSCRMCIPETWRAEAPNPTHRLDANATLAGGRAFASTL